MERRNGRAQAHSIVVNPDIFGPPRGVLGRKADSAKTVDTTEKRRETRERIAEQQAKLAPYLDPPAEVVQEIELMEGDLARELTRMAREGATLDEEAKAQREGRKKIDRYWTDYCDGVEPLVDQMEIGETEEEGC